MLKDGKWYRYIGGAWVPEKQFELMFPLPSKIGNNSDNPNKYETLPRMADKI